MTPETDKARSGAVSWKTVVVGVIIVCAVGALWLFFTVIPTRSPWFAPDLKNCTRVEIECQPSVLQYFEVLAANSDLLSPEEREYLQSLKTSTLNDRLMIRWMAHLLSWISLSADTGAKPDGQVLVQVRGYHNDKCVASFGMYDHEFLVTDDGQVFRPESWPDVVSSFMELSSFDKRSICAQRLLLFAQELRCGHGRTRRDVPVSEWCEEIWQPTVPAIRHAPPLEVQRRRHVQEMERSGQYQCPSAGKGRCHYAMNADCEPNSPADTVLMFETNAGWNQHGGPELFAFHHHSPRGGCVLLNDGTVKFIRTEEELKQLRWK